MLGLAYSISELQERIDLRADSSDTILKNLESAWQHLQIL
jgi:hypothetical protein